MKTISEPIMEDIKTSNGVLRSYVSLTIQDSQGKYILSKFYVEDSDIIKLRINPKLVIRMQFNDVKWVATHQISFNRKYILRFQNIIKKFYRKLMTGKNFLYNEEGTELIDVVRDKTDICYFQTDLQRMVIEPDILEDNKSNYQKKPGVKITLNEPGNVMILSIDEFQDLVLAIINLDLLALGNDLMIIQESIASVRGEDILRSMEEREPPKRTVAPESAIKAKSMFDISLIEPNKENEEVVTGAVMEKQPETLEDIK